MYPSVVNGTWMKCTAVLYPEDAGGFSVRCLEIGVAISRGETREEELTNIKEAIGLILNVRREELHKKSPAIRREISTVEVADVV